MHRYANLGLPTVIEEAWPQLGYHINQRKLGNKAEPSSPLPWFGMLCTYCALASAVDLHSTKPDPKLEPPIHYRRPGYYIGDVAILGNRGHFDFDSVPVVPLIAH